jgi:hypothetical protein
MNLSCPLGHKCQTYDSTGLVDQCLWYVTLSGSNPQTGDPVNQAKCAVAWMPIVGIEQAMTNRGQTAALESFRNEVCSAGHRNAELMRQTLLR